MPWTLLFNSRKSGLRLVWMLRRSWRRINGLICRLRLGPSRSSTSRQNLEGVILHNSRTKSRGKVKNIAVQISPGIRGDIIEVHRIHIDSGHVYTLHPEGSVGNINAGAGVTIKATIRKTERNCYKNTKGRVRKTRSKIIIRERVHA